MCADVRGGWWQGWHFDYKGGGDSWIDEPITVADWQASPHTPARRGILQFKATLLPSSCYSFVPRSHRRQLSEGERAAMW